MTLYLVLFLTNEIPVKIKLHLMVENDKKIFLETEESLTMEYT